MHGLEVPQAQRTHGTWTLRAGHHSILAARRGNEGNRCQQHSTHSRTLDEYSTYTRLHTEIDTRTQERTQTLSALTVAPFERASAAHHQMGYSLPGAKIPDLCVFA